MADYSKAALVGNDGHILAVIKTNLKAGPIEYGWDYFISRSHSILLNPQKGKLTRSRDWLEKAADQGAYDSATLIDYNGRRFLILDNHTTQHF